MSPFLLTVTVIGSIFAYIVAVGVAYFLFEVADQVSVQKGERLLGEGAYTFFSILWPLTCVLVAVHFAWELGYKSTQSIMVGNEKQNGGVNNDNPDTGTGQDSGHKHSAPGDAG